MRIYFTTIVWLLTVRGSLPLEVKNNGAPLNTPCKSASVDQTAYTGDSVSFTCKYSQADKNSIRNFCRLDGNNGCANIISAQLSNYTKLAKISLSDDKQRGLYKVDISMVTQQDSGKYWCALKKDDFITCLQEVVLHVLNPVTVQTYPEKGESPLPPLLVKIRSNRDSGCDSDSGCDDEKVTQGSKTGMIAGIVCGVVIVVVLAIVLILCRRKLCNRQGETSEQKINTIQSAERNDRDHQYEEIQMQNKQANTVCTLYSTVNPPADQLHYASVNIQGGDPTTGSDQNASAHPPAETTLYSTVTKPGE
ncbi:CMRF35-like molecule 8 [Xiphophorus couchianus]|uniref:CMRF35-like molecule 8 n=1 Tax=Xiphophorus couchianus TaxID=32473 RepID=UPI0010171588|nr:CMRF35-like molecule 8 [Xiphophorus couchianus]